MSTCKQMPLWMLAALAVTALAAAPAADGASINWDVAAYTNLFGYNTSGVHDPMEPYFCGTYNGVTVLDPDPPEIIDLTVEDDVDPNDGRLSFAEITSSFSAYDFSYATGFNGTFNIHTYDAVGNCSFVGAEFHTSYTPGAGDPALSASLHWIQTIETTHPLHGRDGDGYTDIPPGQTDPYYDTVGAAGQIFVSHGGATPVQEFHFYDFPKRSPSSVEHTWLASLYLVEQGATANGVTDVTVYGGLRWGWANTVQVVPEPAGLSLLALGLAGLALRRAREGRDR